MLSLRRVTQLDRTLTQQTDKSGKKVRCMFLASVAVGRAFKTQLGRLDPNANLCPPPGFDSVMGEVRI